MRILIYNWRDLAHPNSGGAEVYTDAVARSWINEGHDVTLFTSTVQGRQDSEISNGGYVVIRRGGRHTVYREGRRFWHAEGRGHFDLVIDEVNTRPFGCPRWVTEVPVVAVIHQVAREVWFHETSLPVAILGRYWLERHWLSLYTTTPTVTLSVSSRRSLEAYGLRNVSVVPAGMDFQYAGPIPNLQLKESTPTFAFVGRLASNKRPKAAIEAFGLVRKIWPEARLWVMGTGPMEAELRRMAPPGVEFLGWVPDEEKYERLARSHALLITSVREGWGLVVTEAAALGTPSFGYNVSGLCDSIAASGGFLTAESPVALADRLITEMNALLAGNCEVAPRGVTTWPEVAVGIMSVAAESSRKDVGVQAPAGNANSLDCEETNYADGRPFRQLPTKDDVFGSSSFLKVVRSKRGAKSAKDG